LHQTFHSSLIHNSSTGMPEFVKIIGTFERNEEEKKMMSDVEK
jgi:hypothetical protein